MHDPLPSAPPSYDLQPGQVHIWRVTLPAVATDAIEIPKPMAADDKRRAERFIFKIDRARFIACRIALRTLLSRYIGIPAADIEIDYEPGGKPILGTPNWQFNVSHSDDIAAIAISREIPVGVDIERLKDNFPIGEVAPEVLSPEEIRVLQTLAPQAQPAHFFKLWTMKEALLKAAGTGFSIDPSSIQLQLSNGPGATVLSAPAQFLGAYIQSCNLGSDVAAAVAALSPVSEISVFSFE